MSSENISLTVSQITTITYADMFIYSHLWINLVDKPNEILQGIPGLRYGSGIIRESQNKDYLSTDTLL